jgi:ABC-2 type transport system permease protein
VPSFPIWLLSGLLIWNLFSTGLAAATSSVVSNAALVKKVSFPREILPLASIGSALVHFFLQSLVLFAVLAVVRWDVAWAYVPLVPVALVALLLLTAAFGILFSAVNVYLRDTQHFLELALLAWFWLTPIVYSFMLVGGRRTASGDVPWSTKLFMLNPVTPVVITFQRAIYARLTNPKAPAGSQELLPTWSVWGYLAYLGMTFAFAGVVFVLAFRVFGRSEANFAEEL